MKEMLNFTLNYNVQERVRGKETGWQLSIYLHEGIKKARKKSRTYIRI